ncbi:uncharacterized protein K489DRAFT_377563 [Dissoconium aciculare CBS 342.82]|uniref:Uncharacterized protein n=1 Tax=Dissoconium aciculare CBS 342.82 TaxID=1314786 RepID=A0A6J3MBL9_9PEZI|nr:uncharacterized protein K489DRAFT_377563 [Dissoconium aciculare CBS 342.82]KAF1825024.1 hypothetical protein K489DRAFT_377563 [Dissoconium aciculare CBS 342.82]
MPALIEVWAYRIRWRHRSIFHSYRTDKNLPPPSPPPPPPLTMNRPGAYAGGRDLHMYHIATVKLGNPPCDRRERKRRRRTAFANPYDLLFHLPLNGASVQNMGSGGSEVGRRQPP